MHRALDIRHIERPAFRLSQFIQQNPADLYLLQHSSLPIQKWFKEQHIPCIVLGSTWIDINLPCVDIDQAAVGVHAASVIQRLGHTQIGLIHPVPEKRGIQILTDTLKLNLADSNIHMAGHQDTPESIARAVTQLLNKTKDTPTILLSPTPYAIITAFTTAVNMGYRVPENLSLLCLSYDKVLTYLNPTVAGYHIPIDDYPKAVFKSIVEYLTHPNSQSGSQRLITPDFVKGGSISQTS